MKTLRQIGAILNAGETVPIYLTSSHQVVTKNNKNIKDYAKYLLTHPWQSECYGFDIEPVNDEKGKFLCEYNVICMDDLEINIYGYGNTPQKAEEECGNLLGWIERNQPLVF